MELKNTSEIISNYIWECSKIIHVKKHNIAKEYGLTYDQFHLLIYLKKLNEPPTINNISNKLKRAQNTVSEKISRLEEKGYVKRIRDEKDRRITRVLITEEGLDILKAINKEKSHRVTYLALSKMEKEEVESLLRTLGKLYMNMKEGEND